jgi:hypothetical protein
MFMSQSLETVDVYIWCDASPQRRGREMFAATIDFFAGEFYGRFMLPLMSLPRGALSAIGKTLTLLWMLWLIVGPSWKSLRCFLNRVRGITTDQGGERLIPNMVDCLPEFLEYLEMPPCSGPEQRHLFPRVIEMPGWKHKFDLLIRRGLSSLLWFPAWLERLKALVAFCRSTLNTETLVGYLRGLGLKGAAQLFGGLHFPVFAHWRWSTLWRCCKELAKALPLLILQFTMNLFPTRGTQLPWARSRRRLLAAGGEFNLSSSSGFRPGWGAYWSGAARVLATPLTTPLAGLWRVLRRVDACARRSRMPVWCCLEDWRRRMHGFLGSGATTLHSSLVFKAVCVGLTHSFVPR